MWGVSDSGHGGRAADTWGMADSQAEDFSPPNLCGLSVQVLGHHQLLTVVDHKGPNPHLHLGKPSSPY